MAPKTLKRVPELSGFPELSDDRPVCPNEFQQCLMTGHRNYETIFFHQSTKTLIVTDLAYSIANRADLLEKIWLRAFGVKNPLGITTYQKKKVFEPSKFKISLSKVLAWDFDRVIVCHGDIIEKGGKSLFQEIWQEFV